MITFQSKADFPKTDAYLKRLASGSMYKNLQAHAEKGRIALANATPKDSGLASQSWTASVVRRGNSWQIIWANTDNENGFPVAVMLQYGYRTGTGGYVRGRDYINPAIKPIFDEIADAVWKEVTRA